MSGENDMAQLRTCDDRHPQLFRNGCPGNYRQPHCPRVGRGLCSEETGRHNPDSSLSCEASSWRRLRIATLWDHRWLCWNENSCAVELAAYPFFGQRTAIPGKVVTVVAHHLPGIATYRMDLGDFVQ